MLSNKNKLIGYFIFIVIGWLLISLLINSSLKDQFLGTNYLNNFNLNFSGIVAEKKKITGNSGLLYLVKVKGAPQEYDQRDSLEYYCCIIKGQKAEIIVSGMRLYQKGDSIFVNGSENKIFHYRKNVLIQKINLSMSRFDLLYKPVKRYHKL